MTQPPPYSGGYPQEPVPGQPQPGGYPPPPAGSPSGFPPPPDATPGGFPPPGQEPPRKNPVGKILGIVGAVVVVAIVLVIVKFVIIDTANDVVDHATNDTNIAEIGDCITDNLIAQNMKVTDCGAADAAFKVTAREDDPAEADEYAQADATCAGTTSVTYLYQYTTTTTNMDWLICLEPADGSNTLVWGEAPAAGECMLNSSDYSMTVSCDHPEASEEIVTSETNPQGKGSTDLDSQALQDSAQAACGSSGWDYFYTNIAMGSSDPLEWLVCTKTL